MSAEFLVAVNVASFALAALDKFVAEDNQANNKSDWRVPESWLYAGAACGGWAGGACAMALLRHKTAKRPFLVKYAAASAAHLALLYEFDLHSLHFGKLL